jgi:Domain of unknown function (DUF4281)
MERIFELSSLAVLPFWALMIFLPHWRMTRKLIGSPLVCALPAALYAALVIPRFAEVWRAVAQPELAGIAALLGSPFGATIGWLHFLAFDLFVGRWIYLDSRERGLSAWIIAPTLFLTLMLGPCGFLLYLIARQTKAYLPGSKNILPVSFDKQ